MSFFSTKKGEDYFAFLLDKTMNFKMRTKHKTMIMYLIIEKRFFQTKRWNQTKAYPTWKQWNEVMNGENGKWNR